RIAYEILDNNHGPENLAIVGLQTRGVHIGKRIASIIEGVEKVSIPVGVLDVTMYRDDYRIAMKQPKVRITSIPFEVEGFTIVLVDDVFYTGRTVRSALDAMMDFGRPGRIELAALIDRGHRELPLRADYIGKIVPTDQHEEIRVRMVEEDGKDEVTLVAIAERRGC
ncbi:MAG: bifunctional pyr operon transcriptional regulator/uracil phosphoribosyltransferase PyrR, partial [Candidatus Latescibacteria bacterium]|nr:bifunctional pyr operon transcriptional regulator/uracil phosphoribosyltransferase PyrR [Candidatus Latescibacterota bacterium]